MIFTNESAPIYPVNSSVADTFWRPFNRVFRRLGYEIVPTRARLPREVRNDYDEVLKTIGPYTFKFLDVRTFLTATLGYAYRLGLHKSAPLSILDLGTGTGYFPVVCAHYGHRAIGIDRHGNRVFEDVCEWLGVDRRTHEIRGGKPLPVLETQFDLVTAFMVNFDQFIEGDFSPWGVDEWDYLLRDIAENQLRPNGRLVLRLNPHTTRNAEVMGFLWSKGGKITNDWVEFPNFGARGEPTRAEPALEVAV
jgi:SAM-dependent methyltransferase